MAHSPAAQGPRRELKTRDKAWAHSLARRLSGYGWTPNAISILSIVFSVISMALFLLAPELASRWGMCLAWAGAAAAIQGRLLCNLLDGLVAVECGKAKDTGPIFNEVPDRAADVLILVGAGYSTAVEPGVIKLFDVLPLGWSCAVLAMGTAYLRLLQGTLTERQSFMGPMAKQHRMAVLTGGALVAAVEIWFHSGQMWALKGALIVIFVGSIVTCWRRLMLLVQEMRGEIKAPF